MLHLYDRATMARALTLDLDPLLRRLLVGRIEALKTADYDLTDDTEILIVEAGDTEADIVRHIGFSPLVEPINGYRWPHSEFTPYWDYLADHNGVFEMIVTFGSTFAHVLLMLDVNGVLPSLRALCREHS